MLKIVVILCFIQISIVCGQTVGPQPLVPSYVGPKQFRYVNVDEPSPKPSAERQEAIPRAFVVPHIPTANQDDYQPDEPRRPLVSVNSQKDDSGLGKKVDVGVNVGRGFQMDLQRQDNFGSRALNLGLNVLNGLVKVNVQRDRDSLGSTRRGPIVVQVGGHTIYDNGQ